MAAPISAQAASNVNYLNLPDSVSTLLGLAYDANFRNDKFVAFFEDMRRAPTIDNLLNLTDKDAGLTLAIAKDPNTPQVILDKLAERYLEDVAMALIGHPNISNETLDILISRELNPLVSKAAQQKKDTRNATGEEDPPRKIVFAIPKPMYPKPELRGPAFEEDDDYFQ
jgi:hypothetical protein